MESASATSRRACACVYVRVNVCVCYRVVKRPLLARLLRIRSVRESVLLCVRETVCVCVYSCEYADPRRHARYQSSAHACALKQVHARTHAFASRTPDPNPSQPTRLLRQLRWLLLLPPPPLLRQQRRRWRRQRRDSGVWPCREAIPRDEKPRVRILDGFEMREALIARQGAPAMQEGTFARPHAARNQRDESRSEYRDIVI